MKPTTCLSVTRTADQRHAADIDSVLRISRFFDRHNLLPVLQWVRGLEKALNAAKAAIILAGPHGLGNIQQYERDLAVCRQSRDPLSVESGTPEQTYAKFIVQAEAENSAALSD